MFQEKAHAALAVRLSDDDGSTRRDRAVAQLLAAYNRRASEPASDLPSVEVTVEKGEEGWSVARLTPKSPVDPKAVSRFVEDWAETLTALWGEENRAPGPDGTEHVARQLEPLAASSSGEMMLMFIDPDIGVVVHLHLSQRQAVELCAAAARYLRPD